MAKTKATESQKNGSVEDAAVNIEHLDLKLSELHPFEGHPFKVLDDELMEQTVESIKQIGIFEPLVVRPLIWMADMK